MQIFFLNQSQSYTDLQPLLTPNEGPNKSTLPKNLFMQVLNQI